MGRRSVGDGRELGGGHSVLSADTLDEPSAKGNESKDYDGGEDRARNGTWRRFVAGEHAIGQERGRSQ